MKNSLKGTIINGFNEYPIIFITVLGGFLIFFKPSKCALKCHIKWRKKFDAEDNDT